MKLRKIGFNTLALAAFAGVFALASCGKSDANTTGTNAKNTTTVTTTTATTSQTTSEVLNDVLSYSEYVAAEEGETVTIKGSITSRCTFYGGKASFYLQDDDGAYYIYNLPCTEEDYTNNLTVGTEIKVTGYKGSWSGQVEILGDQAGNEAEYEIIGTGKTYSPKEVTLAELKNYPNQYVVIRNLTVVAQKDKEEKERACFYNWDNSGEPKAGTDLYYTVTDGTTTYQFVVESYLETTQYGSNTYSEVENLSVGATIDVEGFAYTYNNPQVQTTKVTNLDK